MEFSPANRKALGLIFLVLVLGIGLGAVGEVFVNQRVLARPQVQVQNQRGPSPVRAVPRLTKELDLTLRSGEATERNFLTEMQNCGSMPSASK